ncbi:unnamed protein product [Staurois parvus]|uniref:Uncharacterized protein n=1 Tax=Staurois parvus TaxID=386267 RepID=A0ABN9DCR5_9NEOB|nr:unnamed protein product [Staurois parvus]
MTSGSYILFTTINVITDWPISDHMNQDLKQRPHTAIAVSLCLEDTAEHRSLYGTSV